MSSASQIPEGETGFDRLLSFTIPARNARGRIVRLGPVLETILAAHDYPPPIKHLLAEALVITALIGGLFKDEDGQLTVQAQTSGGIVGLLVCDYRGGELRGTFATMRNGWLHWAQIRRCSHCLARDTSR